MPAPARSKSKNPYSVHPGVAMMQKWVAELKGKTGRSLEEWVKLVKKEGPSTEKERRDWLKKKHGLGTNSAWWIAEQAEGKQTVDSDPELYLQAALQYVEEMFTGGKEGLRPIYDALIELGLGIGPGVKACPCKTIVPLYRNHVFAQIKPTTRTRIDLGLCFKDYKGKLPKRLVATGGAAKGDRITHRFEISTPSDVDAEVKRWFKAAYDLDA